MTRQELEAKTVKELRESLMNTRADEIADGVWTDFDTLMGILENGIKGTNQMSKDELVEEVAMYEAIDEEG